MPWFIYVIQVKVWAFFSPSQDENQIPINQIVENMLMWELDKRIQKEKDRKAQLISKRLNREYGTEAE